MEVDGRNNIDKQQKKGGFVKKESGKTEIKNKLINQRRTKKQKQKN